LAKSGVADAMTVVEQTLQRYALNTQEDKAHALPEVMQEIALEGLNRGGFIKKKFEHL
jgi:hypothetical protein